MMPLLLLAFTLYFRVDKMLLLRFYERPPKMGDAVMKVSTYLGVCIGPIHYMFCNIVRLC